MQKDLLKRTPRFQELRIKRVNALHDREEKIRQLDLEKQEKKCNTTFKEYEKIVRDITEKQPIEFLENYDKRGFLNYHVDHIISIWHGYKNFIDPIIIGGINNLQMLPMDDNLKKGHSSYSHIPSCKHLKILHYANKNK